MRSLSLISTDSGAHWRHPPGDVQIMQLATATGKTYARIINNTDAARLRSNRMARRQHGWAAESGMPSVRPSLLDIAPLFPNLLLGASSNDLLAATYENTLWRSADGGATWSRITTPNQSRQTWPHGYRRQGAGCSAAGLRRMPRAALTSGLLAAGASIERDNLVRLLRQGRLALLRYPALLSQRHHR